MTIQLDHVMVLSANKKVSAEFLARVLNVSCGLANVGPFYAVYVSDALTIDFDEVVDPVPIQHLCFHVTDAEFDEILERIVGTGIEFRSLPHGPSDRTVNTRAGGRLLYWTAPDGHIWEVLTKSYARQASA